MEISEVKPTGETLNTLIAFSRDWEAERSCWGYRANGPEDIEGNRVFMAWEEGAPVGYLFGHASRAKQMTSVAPDGTPIFEMEELYVVPEQRSRGIGRALFDRAAEAVAGEAEYIFLSTATKNWKSILHFYIEELGMEFWSARLFKKLR